jgi:hypothetical protein
MPGWVRPLNLAELGVTVRLRGRIHPVFVFCRKLFPCRQMQVLTVAKKLPASHKAFERSVSQRN